MVSINYLKLKQARVKKGLSVEDLIRHLHDRGYKVSRHALYNWERGNTPLYIGIFVELCHVLGVGLDEIAEKVE